jgi:D-lactate dehydrogenase (cytochrome)
MTLMEPLVPVRRDPSAIEAAVRALSARFGNRLVTSQAVREQHGTPSPGSRTSRPTR